MIVDAPWYEPNTLIRQDIQIPSVKEEISHYSSHYSARLTAHPYDILLTLLTKITNQLPLLETYRVFTVHKSHYMFRPYGHLQVYHVYKNA
jgi:hypothetical protein